MSAPADAPEQQCAMPNCSHRAVDPSRAGALCADHLDGLEDDDRDDREEAADSSAEEVQPTREHENPIDASDVTDEQRARMLTDYLDAFRAEFGRTPKLMPLDAEGKGPCATGNFSVREFADVGYDADGERVSEKVPTEAGLAAAVDGYEAARQIAEEGARGFALYAGVPEFGTEGVAFVDHDSDEFPAPTGEPTLRVLSGSGRADGHETYRNDPDDPVQNARVGDDLGEIRAEFWYVVVPGSVHPTGGVYHVVEEREIATLSDADLTDDMRPGSSATTYTAGDNPVLEDIEGTGETPDDDELTERLEAAFADPDDGERIKDVYNGNYAAAGFNDRSYAEWWLACRLDSYVGLGNADRVEQVMDDANLQKWSERTDRAYRNSTLSGVGTQEWYYNPDGGDEPGEPTREPVAALPFAYLDTLDTDEARRAAKRRGLEWPDTAEARDRLRDTIFRTVRSGGRRVIRAPTSLGKSHTVATEPWLRRTSTTGDSPVIQLAPTKDARDENAETSERAGVSHAVLRGRTDTCPIARGDHDPENAENSNNAQPITVDNVPASEWFSHQCSAKGLPFQLAHAHIAEHNDQNAELPCHEGDTECPAVAQWEGVPRDDDGNPSVDVVHATHHFAYVPSIRNGTNLVFDELPSAFSVGLDQGRIERAVRAYLREIGAPVSSYWSLVSLAESDGYQDGEKQEREELEAAFHAEDVQPEREWYIHEDDAHALAPDLARAVYNAARYEDRDTNGRRATTVLHEPPRFDTDGSPDGDTPDGIGDSFLTVVLDDTGAVASARNVPGLTTARSVVGLDAHPSAPLWQRNAHPEIDVERIMDPIEHRLWRRFERGLTVVQVGDATRPRSGENALEWDADDRKLDALVRRLWAEYGGEFQTAITTQQVEERLADRLRDTGVLSPETMHFGAEASNNSFAGESVGLVNGCMDPGDDYVINLLAELDCDAWPARVDPEEFDDRDDAHCGACDGGGCSQCFDTGLKREKGRGFDGPDADVAAELLASVRENRVAQAAGRYARNADDPTDTAIVYVRTDAIPDELVDVRANGVEWLPSGLQRDIADALADRADGASAKGLAEDIGCSDRHVRKTLTRLEERNIVTRDEGAGPNPDRWHTTAHATLEAVDLGPIDGDSSTDGGTDEKLEQSPNRVLVGGRSSFSAVIGSVSQPGELALSTEEITAQVLGGEELEPPGVS